MPTPPIPSPFDTPAIVGIKAQEKNAWYARGKSSDLDLKKRGNIKDEMRVGRVGMHAAFQPPP